jgi:hypothetical protein
MKYKTLSDVLQALADGRTVNRNDIAARVLDCHVWISGAGSPGCLYDSGPNYHATKADAVSDLLFIADSGEGAPRGMRAALMRGEYVQHDGWNYEMSRDTLRSIL